MPFDLIIFDCDGVLVDSEPIADRVLREMLETVEQGPFRSREWRI